MNIEENEDNEFYDKPIEEEQNDGENLINNFDEMEQDDIRQHHNEQESSNNERQEVGLIALLILFRTMKLIKIRNLMITTILKR